MLSYPELRDQLASQHFARIPFAKDETRLAPIIDAFFAFMTLPEETKTRFSYRLIPDDRGTEVGYWTRSRATGALDNRGYFHYNTYGDERFRAEGQDCPELIRLLDAVRPLFLEGQEAMKAIIRTFDQEFPGFYDQIFPADRHPLLLLRLLAYERMEPGDFLAKGHYDRGTCTIAIAESAPGLRIGTTPENVRPVEHHPDYALFFPGLTMKDYTSEAFPPSWHEVIQQEEHLLNEKTARWAIVLFAGAWGQRNMTWQEAHDPKY